MTIEDSKYSHRLTLGLGNYRSKAFITGDHYSKVATELLDMTTMEWSEGPYYPHSS